MSANGNDNTVNSGVVAEQPDLFEEIPPFLRRERKSSSPEIEAQSGSSAESDLVDAFVDPASDRCTAETAAILPVMNIGGEHAQNPGSDNAETDSHDAMDTSNAGL